VILCLLIALGIYEGTQASELKLTKDGKYFVQMAKEYNFDQAKAFCSENGMSLVTIDSPEKEQVVVDHIVEAYKALPQKACSSPNKRLCEQRKLCTIGYFWTAGKELDQNKDPREFTWTTTNKPVSDYTNWGVGQPNNWGGKNDQTCLEFNVYYGHGVADWNDERCTGKNMLVCEKM